MSTHPEPAQHTPTHRATPVVHVEFLGMARHYAGVDQLAVAAADFEMLWEQLRQQLPQFAQQALTPHGLMPGFLICFEGGPFLADFDRPLRDGDHLLILSLDVGG